MSIKIEFNFIIPLILTIIFVICKGLHIIDWAWYWLMSPIWIMSIIVVITLIIFKIKRWI